MIKGKRFVDKHILSGPPTLVFIRIYYIQGFLRALIEKIIIYDIKNINVLYFNFNSFVKDNLIKL